MGTLTWGLLIYGGLTVTEGNDRERMKNIDFEPMFIMLYRGKQSRDPSEFLQ